MRLLFTFLFLVAVFWKSSAQLVPAPLYYNNLKATTSFPKGLQSKRSVVIINIEEDWRAFSATVHEKLRLMSIDPILYVDYRDLTAGVDASKAILKHLETRKASQIITFHQNEYGQYEVNITSAKNFLKVGKTAFNSTRFSHQDLQRLLKQMANELIKAELDKSNFLMAEHPEFLEDIKLLENRKFEVHARDVNRLKLAVPRFMKIDEEVISNLTDKQAALDYNNKIDRWNSELDAIMKEFPFKYELVDVVESNDLYKKGFQFALFHVHTKGSTIKRMLNMDTQDTETEYVSYTTLNNLKRIAVETPVTKFYIKQVVSNDVYTGDKWDADTTWQAALKNYIYNFRKFVKR